MLDTNTIARALEAAELSPAQADAIAAAVRQAAEYRTADTATRADVEQLRADLGHDLAALEARLTWRFGGALATAVLAILGGMFALLRLLLP